MPDETTTEPSISIPQDIPQNSGSEASAMLSEPLEASTSTDIPVSLNNANSEPENTLENQAPISPEPTEPLEIKPEPIEANPEPTKASEAGTAQIPVNEPLNPITEPLENKSLARQLLVKARNVLQFRKRKKLDKIMSLYLKHSKITNKEVGDFLHVSDATATRYLDILEKENKIKQVGKTGHAVSYSRI